MRYIKTSMNYNPFLGNLSYLLFSCTLGLSSRESDSTVLWLDLELGRTEVEREMSVTSSAVSTVHLGKRMACKEKWNQFRFNSKIKPPYFHWLVPLGRVSLVVAMSVTLNVECMLFPPNAIYFEASHWPWDHMISFQAVPEDWTRGPSPRGALKQGFFRIGLLDCPCVEP